MWARGYFCCSTGNVAGEMAAEYIANQMENRDDDFNSRDGAGRSYPWHHGHAYPSSYRRPMFPGDLGTFAAAWIRTLHSKDGWGPPNR